MMEHILLLKLPPISMEAIWGDGTLTRRYHLEMADGYDIDRCPFGGGFSEECTIQNGEYKGRSLKWLYKHHPDYFGSADQRKWKDMMAISMGACWASEDLSVQVHPREDWAMEHLHAHGKSECWYFPETVENNTVVFGSRAKTMEEFDEYIRRGAWEELMVRHPVKPGSFYAINAGTLHAVQKGSYFIEICNPSPVTYRFYDYDRLDSNGKPRKLDMEKAKENLLVPDQPVVYNEVISEYGSVTEQFMADNGNYSAWLYKVKGTGCIPLKKPFAGCFVIYGKGTINDIEVREGQSFMLTNACKEFVLQGDMEIICCHG